MNIHKYNKKYITFIISIIITLQSIIGTSIHAKDINNIPNTLLNDYMREEGNKNISLLKFSSSFLIVEIGPYILGSRGKITGKL